LGAIERLDLALLVDRQNDGVGGRVDIESDDILELVDEQRVIGELELAPTMGLKAVRLPNPSNRTGADAGRPCHHVGGPVRRLARRVRERQRHHPLGDFRAERGNARGPCLVAQQPLEPFLGEPLLPAPHAGLGLAGSPHDLHGAVAVGAQQDDPGAPGMLLPRIAVVDERRQPLAIGRRNPEGDSCTHAPDSHAPMPKGIPIGLLC
jgi:hypothetical protein